MVTNECWKFLLMAAKKKQGKHEEDNQSKVEERRVASPIYTTTNSLDVGDGLMHRFGNRETGAIICIDYTSMRLLCICNQ